MICIDQYCQNIYRYLILIVIDLKSNHIIHNLVIFDTRFQFKKPEVKIFIWTNLNRLNRYNGAKGILLKVDNDDPDFKESKPGKEIILRYSNVKFETRSIEFGCIRENQSPSKKKL